LILFQASEFNILLSKVACKRRVVKTTNFHDLQLALHLIVVAVLFELLFEVIDLGGLQRFVSGGTLKTSRVFVHQTLNFAGIVLAFLLQRLLLDVHQDVCDSKALESPSHSDSSSETWVSRDLIL